MPGLTSFAGGRLFGRRFGADSPKVLALHGWGRSSKDFERVLDGIDAVALDLPGFGASPPPADPIGAEGYALLVRPVLEELDTPIVLIGHSFGGRIAVALGGSDPGSVASLVLTGVPLVRREPPRRPGLGFRLARSAHRAGLLSEDQMERLRRRRGSADYRAATGVMRDVLVVAVNESYHHQLAQIQAPVRLVWGAEDAEVPVDVAERAATVLADAGVPVELEVLEGVGHLVPIQAPEVLRRHLDEVLSR